MRAMLLTSAALAFVASGAVAQEMTEIDEAASTLEQILGEQAEFQEGPQEVRVVRATIDPNTMAAWHTHPTPVYLYVTEGELLMQIEGKEDRTYQAGEALAEPLDARMRVGNPGDTPTEVVVFQISPADQEFLEQDE